MNEATTRPSEFLKFYSFLMLKAPPDYHPWLFRCDKDSKAPALRFGSWKNEVNRLTCQEAFSWLQKGGNVGLAGTHVDPLVNLDADGGLIKLEELKPTLTSRTRSRVGLHAFYFTREKEKISNIPTDDAGEVRSSWQYVITPGSYVKADPAAVPEDQREDAGYYTVEDARAPAWVTYNELPQIFRDIKERNKAIEQRKTRIFVPKKAKGKHSAIFDLTARDVVLREGGDTRPSERWASIFHGSTTDANMSLSRQGLLHCWRHGVSHNALQALCVLSGYMSCLEAGSPHISGGGSPSMVVGDDGAIFEAWRYAKEHCYIPKDDPIPVKAMRFIAAKHLGCKIRKKELLPADVYNRVLKIVMEEY